MTNMPIFLSGTVRRRFLPFLLLLWCLFFLLNDNLAAQNQTVRGTVVYDPTENDCLETAESCARNISLPQNWKPPAGAVNILIRQNGISQRAGLTDRQGNFEVSIPSSVDTLVFSYIGYQRAEVAVGGRNRIDVKLSPLPLPEIDRLLGYIMPAVAAGKYPDITELARKADVNYETARDLLWLVLGNRPMSEAYPGVEIPDYRFQD